MLILRALAGGRQQLMSLDLPHDGEDMDRTAAGPNGGGPHLHDGLDGLLHLLLLPLLVLLHNAFLLFQK